MVDRAPHLDDVRCSDLALDVLDPAGRRDALAHAEGCAACAERLRAHVGASVRAIATAPGTFAVTVPATHARASVLRLRMRWALPVSLAAAASLAVVFALQPDRREQAPTSTRWLASPSDPLVLRMAEPTDEHLSAGLAAYARHDLVVAERELSVAKATELAEQARRLYLAHTLFLRGDAAHALALLRTLQYASLPAIVQHDAVGLLAAVRRTTGDRTGADSLERALAGTPEWAPVIP